jgi:hypothetical protein
VSNDRHVAPFPERDAALKTLKWLRTNIEKCPIVNTEGKPIT